MHVLHIAPGNLYGGVETLLVTLARFRELCPSMEPEFAVCFEGRLSRELTEAGVPVHRLGVVRTRHPLSVWHARNRLSELMHQRKFDAVVCHMAWSHAMFGPVVKAAGVALIVWRHSANNDWHWLERWARLTRPELMLCNSQFTQKSVDGKLKGLPAEVIYYPVALQSVTSSSARGTALRSELGTGQHATVVIQVSRMEAWKGHALHLRALSKLRKRDDWACWIIGGAQRSREVRYMKQLRAMAVDLGIDDRVVFLGQHTDVPRFLAAADIFCQPNLGPEPFGIVFIEALYAGLPVVTTAIGGGAEIVDDSCGILVPPNDESALAHALRELMEDSGRRSLLSLGGPRRAKELCDPARQIRALIDSIARVCRNQVRHLQGASRLRPRFHSLGTCGPKDLSPRASDPKH